MARRKRELAGSKTAMSLATRFTLSMTLALTAVMTAAGVALYSNAAKVTASVQTNALVYAVRMTGTNQQIDSELKRLEIERQLLESLEKFVATNYAGKAEFTKLRNELKTMWGTRTTKKAELELNLPWRQVEGQPAVDIGEQVKRMPIEIGSTKAKASLLRYSTGDRASDFDLLTPFSTVEAENQLLGVIIAIIVAAIGVGALVSVLVASQASRPIVAIADDVRHIATGDLAHTTRARGVHEVNVLARSIDRMAADLSAAQEAKLELSVREREFALVSEVRESLRPNATPVQSGYEFAALGMSAANLGCDFHDFISTPGGGVGLLVCDVSGRGLPGTLVGATARAYLRAELTGRDDLREALFHVNRELARDVRRGMYVSALYVLLDPKTHVVRIACAGHKIPLVHFVAATGKLALVQPEGIALGFDKGPIFESRLELAELKLEAGDRLTIFNSGPAVLVNSEGKEFGEKNLYAQVQRHGARSSEEFLDRLRSVLEAFAGGTALERDISILTSRRV